MQGQEFWVQKDDLRKFEFHDVELAPLAAGDVRFRIDHFAFTANNVTYGAVGEMIGYWKFFPTGKDGWGKIPVWGFANVEASNAEGIDVGERVYGYFPMATHLDVTPAKITKNGFRDGATHRADLPPIYNEYMRVANIDGHDAALEDRLALLRPLYATSYLIVDFLEDNDFFGAEQIVICSASSKTAIGFAQLLAEGAAAGRKIVGLTSSGNREFVAGLGAYDQVATYDAIADDIAKRPTVYVDMAGNAETRGALHHHLKDEIKYGCGVGITHWDKGGAANDLPGPRPQMFFAPGQIEKRRKDWGRGVVEGKIADAVDRLTRQSTSWMDVIVGEGPDAVAQVYSAMVEGKISPREGRILSL